MLTVGDEPDDGQTDVFSSMLDRLQGLNDRLSSKEAEAVALMARKWVADGDTHGITKGQWPAILLIPLIAPPDHQPHAGA